MSIHLLPLSAKPNQPTSISSRANVATFLIFRITLLSYQLLTKMTLPPVTPWINPNTPKIINLYTTAGNENPKEYIDHLSQCLEHTNEPGLQNFWCGRIPGTPPQYFGEKLKRYLVSICFASALDASFAFDIWAFRGNVWLDSGLLLSMGLARPAQTATVGEIDKYPSKD